MVVIDRPLAQMAQLNGQESIRWQETPVAQRWRGCGGCANGFQMWGCLA
jgi:hypothetical protein